MWLCCVKMPSTSRKDRYGMAWGAEASVTFARSICQGIQAVCGVLHGYKKEFAHRSCEIPIAFDCIRAP